MIDERLFLLLLKTLKDVAHVSLILDLITYPGSRSSQLYVPSKLTYFDIAGCPLWGLALDVPASGALGPRQLTRFREHVKGIRYLELHLVPNCNERAQACILALIASLPSLHTLHLQNIELERAKFATRILEADTLKSIQTLSIQGATLYHDDFLRIIGRFSDTLRVLKLFNIKFEEAYGQTPTLFTILLDYSHLEILWIAALYQESNYSPIVFHDTRGDLVTRLEVEGRPRVKDFLLRHPGLYLRARGH